MQRGVEEAETGAFELSGFQHRKAPDDFGQQDGLTFYPRAAHHSAIMVP